MSGKISEYFRIRKQEREEFAQFLEDTERKISTAETEYLEIFKDPAYIDIQTTSNWENKFTSLHDDASSYLKDGMIEKKKLPKKYLTSFSKMEALYAHMEKNRLQHNRRIIEGNRTEAEQVFTNVMGKKPAEYQIDAMLAEDQRVLVSGAPSTGKTAALQAKFQYLKEKCAVPASEMLFLDCSDRKGFAAVAKKILKQCGAGAEQIPSVRRILLDMIRKFLSEKSADSSYRSRLVDYYMRFHAAGYTAFDFESYEDYQKYLELEPPVTLRGERVKSYEELEIANFLYALGIEYSYNAPFVKEVLLPGARTPYKPDFTLKDYKICINLYKIDRAGTVVDENQNMLTDAESKAYNYTEYQEMLREVHEKNEIALIECFSYEKMDGTLTSKLQKNLSQIGVSFSIRSDAELLAAIQAVENDFMEFMAESIRCGAESILAAGLDESAVLTLSRTKSNTTAPLYKRRERLLSLILPFYQYYMETVPSDDYRVLAEAADALSGHKAAVSLQYLFLDNLEALNAVGWKLVSALQQSSGCKVAAAGSSWCAYTGRFGADPIYLQDFGRFFPKFSEVECTTVFDIPKALFQKIRELTLVKSKSNDSNTRYAGGSETESASGEIEAIRVNYENEESMQDKMAMLLTSFSEEKSVLVACRYDRDAARFSQYIAGKTNVECASVFDASRKYDVVVWVNTRFTNFGFPDEKLCLNNVSDLLLLKPEEYNYSGEKNLLCKAMSLAKSRFILLYDPANESPFLEELLPPKAE